MNTKMDFDYKIIRSDRKTLAVQVDAFGNVLVRSPKKLSDKKIKSFLQEKEEWILKAVEAQKEKSANQKQYSDTDIELMRKKAKQIIPLKVQYYSAVMGVTPESVKINSAKKRFGSCSGENNLNFSLYLMDKDESFIDYVVVHELAHIKHHNHSKEFYAFIEQFMPDYKERSKRC